MDRRHRCHRQAGMAMLLVLISVAMAMILSLTFLNAQVTATGLSGNVARRAQARAIAESGMTMALAYIQTNTNWRTDMTEGTWVSSHSYAGGSFTVTGEDGQDTDGNGTVDGDGLLADDDTDQVTLTATGTFDGFSHTVRAVVTPGSPKRRLLLVVPDPANLDNEEKDRRAQFMDWDFVVTLIGETNAQAAFDSAVTNADVVYIPENVVSTNVNTKLKNAPIGVVWEETNLNSSFSLTNSDSPVYTGSSGINVTNNTHFITQTLPLGVTQIVDSASVELRYFNGTLAPDALTMATQSSSSMPVLAAIETGGTLADSTAAAGKRVALPWGGNLFNWARLMPAGHTIVRRSLQWASERAIPGNIAHWNLDDTSATTASDSVGSYDGTYRNGVAIGQSGAMVNSDAVAFDGVNDHVEVPHDNAFLLDDGTFAFWFKTSDTGSTQGLVSKDSTNFDTGGHMTVWIHNDHVHARMQSNTKSFEIKSGGGTVQPNTWHHVALTFGLGGMKLYFDGSLEQSDTHTGGMGTTSGDIGNYEPMGFGVSAQVSGDLTLSGWSDPLSGSMDEVYAFDRALTQTEIQSLMVPVGSSGLSYDIRWSNQP